jgi:predicted DCC family thiol-disulfide oxidoreductase YuxK
MTDSARSPIIVFDGLCVLCSANAQFILRHDKRGHFRLASMQGDVGAALYRRFGIDPTHPESFIIVDGDRLIRDSDAVLSIYEALGWPWRGLSIFKWTPRGARDPVYAWIARHRYRLFGRRDVCWVPTPDQASRVL